MIQANELRVGNWVNLLIKDEDFGQVKTKMPIKVKDGVHLAAIASYQNQEDFIAPILLTPEILEKAGFEKYSGLTKYKLGGKYKLDLKRKTEAMFKINAGDKYVTIAGLNYLHQLQNLYFALTGQELEINL